MGGKVDNLAALSQEKISPVLIGLEAEVTTEPFWTIWRN
jgi:hypothetical protein